MKKIICVLAFVLIAVSSWAQGAYTQNARTFYDGPYFVSIRYVGHMDLYTMLEACKQIGTVTMLSLTRTYEDIVNRALTYWEPHYTGDSYMVIITHELYQEHYVCLVKWNSNRSWNYYFFSTIRY